MSSYGMRKDVYSLDVLHPTFLLPTTASPTPQGLLKDGFGEAVMACEVPKPCKFPSLDGCQNRFLRTHKEVDLAPHPDVGLAIQDAEKFPKALGFKSLDPFFQSASRVYVSQS